MTEQITWNRVGRALLGRWPSQVAQWGQEGIAAFVEELQADGLTPDQALAGLRQHRPENGKDFPPSVAQVSALARKDPDQPTDTELFAQLYGPGGVFGFKRAGAVVSPWVLAFVEDFGRDRLQLAEVADPVNGKWERKRIEEAWHTFLEVNEGRAVAQIARRSAGSPKQVDAFAAIAQLNQGGQH